MIPFRLLTFLFILSIASKLVTGTGENQEQVPCEDETKTVPTTTTESPTTSGDPCQKYPGCTAYRRQNGWWCSKMFYQDMQLDLPMSYQLGIRLCELNELPYVSSLETQKEKEDYNWLGSLSRVSAYWVNITFDTTKGEYEWGDGYSIPTMNPQPTVIDPNGKGVYTINRGLFLALNAATRKYYWSDGYSVPNIDSQPKVIDPNGQGVWTVNKDPSVFGSGSLSIVQTTGVASTNVRGIVCGGPGN